MHFADQFPNIEANNMHFNSSYSPYSDLGEHLAVPLCQDPCCLNDPTHQATITHMKHMILQGLAALPQLDPCLPYSSFRKLKERNLSISLEEKLVLISETRGICLVKYISHARSKPSTLHFPTP